MSNTAILIPARYASTRFPGKPLATLDGIPMIKRVYDACVASKLPTYVLTDDRRIAELIPDRHFWIDEQYEYSNGTERCAGAVEHCPLLTEYTKFINVQGDMPDVDVAMIQQVQWHLQHYSVTTAFTKMPKEKQDDPNSVKMVRAGDSALWFGRGMTGYGDWHLGIYGYRRNALEMYRQLEVPQEEYIEQLEQLRWLKNAWQIGCLSVQYNGVEINAPEDVDQWHINNKRSQ